MITLSRFCLLCDINSSCFSVPGDSSISDMFGLGLPRGSLMGNQSAAVGSPSYRNYGSYGQSQGSSQPSHEVKRFTYTCRSIFFEICSNSKFSITLSRYKSKNVNSLFPYFLKTNYVRQRYLKRLFITIGNRAC